jgi:translocation and assembly module TamB
VGVFILSLAPIAGQANPSAALQRPGPARAHTLELRASTPARPPAWLDTVQPRATPPAPASTAAATPGSTPETAGSVALLRAEGGLVDGAGAAASGWRGRLRQVEARPRDPGAAAWLRSAEIGIELLWGGPALQARIEPGRADILGAAMRWERIEWQAAAGPTQPGRIEAKAALEPLRVAPLLARLQPEFGWGGDLTLTGRLDIRSADGFAADIVIERVQGDLSVTEETVVRPLGLTEVRLGLQARNGSWTFTQGLAGAALGRLSGTVVATTAPRALWPAADAPIKGAVELQVANLGTWGPWVPPGWRLGGRLNASAAIAGRFGAPEYTGRVEGSQIEVRNFLEGVNVADGDIAIALQGTTARIERFTVRAGSGTLRMSGSASLGEAPKADLSVVAQKFQLLGRVDRRIVTSGEGRLQLDRDILRFDGRFAVDEGLIDFSRSDAPALSDDLVVTRGNQVPPTAAEAQEAKAAAAASSGAGRPGAGRAVALDLRVDLGRQLRLRGRGIDTLLQGELRATAPGGRLALNGTVQTAEGTYAAYGQKLAIDRGRISFSGPVENPRLDIEATRPNLDIRVGVAVGGTALNPRVRLFSEPEMSDVEKLSWLVLGRASEGLGRTETALLQRAAMALLAGEGPGMTDQLIKAIGLDELSVRQSDGEVRETVVSLGKQLSARWYVGYERSLTATTGTWQLVYRIARRFTLRAQSGLDNSLDLIWTWRWQ